MGTTVPPMFTRSWGNEESTHDMEQHFKSSRGSVSHAEGWCTVYKVNVYPENDDVRFADNFINDIRNIDKSETLSEKNAAMERFIEHFGTHYATETSMGVGIQFESRFAEDETSEHTVEERNKCTRKNGLKFFGVQLENDQTECSGSLSETTHGSVGSVSRFSSRTIGTFPVDDPGKWGTIVNANFADGKPDPSPIQRKFDLIINLFSDPP